MRNGIAIARFATQFITTVGVSKVINDIITNNTNIRTTADAVQVWTGSIVIGSLIGDITSKYVNGRLDQVIAWRETRNAFSTAVS